MERNIRENINLATPLSSPLLSPRCPGGDYRNDLRPSFRLSVTKFFRHTLAAAATLSTHILYYTLVCVTGDTIRPFGQPLFLLFVYLMSYGSMRNIKTLFYYQADSPNFYCKRSKILGWFLAAHLVPGCFLVIVFFTSDSNV